MGPERCTYCDGNHKRGVRSRLSHDLKGVKLFSIQERFASELKEAMQQA